MRIVDSGILCTWRSLIRNEPGAGKMAAPIAASLMLAFLALCTHTEERYLVERCGIPGIAICSAGSFLASWQLSSLFRSRKEGIQSNPFPQNEWQSLKLGLDRCDLT